MSCIWIDVNYNTPPVGVIVLVKYNAFRSDSPFTYVVAKYFGEWKQEYMIDGYMMLRNIPKPNWWALIEAEAEHG